MQRRSSCQAPPGTAGGPPGDVGGEGADAKRLHPALLPRCWRLLRGAARLASRRLCDALIVSGLLLADGAGYRYVTSELLEHPPRSTLEWGASALGHALFALYLASWLGVIYHGPGRVPVEQQRCELPETLAVAFAAGRWSPLGREVSAEVAWCGPCKRWKPPMASHCKACNRCSLWMDHHCSFAGQCVGFRNMRCFLVWLAYSLALLSFLALLAVRRLLLGPPLSIWALLRLAAFAALLVAAACVASGNLTVVLENLSNGWPSQVLVKKFWAIFYHADRVRRCVDQNPSPARWGAQCVSALKPLQKALLQVRAPKGFNIKGPFLPAASWPEGLVRTFGEPPSLLWLLPLRPGGTSDALQPPPATLAVEHCNDWAALASLADSFDAPLEMARAGHF